MTSVYILYICEHGNAIAGSLSLIKASLHKFVWIICTILLNTLYKPGIKGIFTPHLLKLLHFYPAVLRRIHFQFFSKVVITGSGSASALLCATE
jgi:hypothetical protein